MCLGGLAFDGGEVPFTLLLFQLSPCGPTGEQLPGNSGYSITYHLINQSVGVMLSWPLGEQAFPSLSTLLHGSAGPKHQFFTLHSVSAVSYLESLASLL